MVASVLKSRVRLRN